MCSRENWLDCLKGIAIILVVLGHVLDGSTGNNLFPNDTWIKSLHTAIYIFHMPLFFCLSGMSLSIMKRKMGGYRDNVYNILYLYVIWSWIGYSCKYLFKNYVTVVYEKSFWEYLIFEPVAPYWYLIVLFYYYLFMSKADFNIEEDSEYKRNILCIVFFCILSGILPIFFDGNSSRKWWFVYKLIYHIPFFLLGILIEQHVKIILGYLKNSKILFIIISVSFLILGVLFHNIFVYPFVEFTIGIFIIITFVLVANSYNSLENNKLLDYLGKNCLYIYLVYNYCTVLFRVIYRKMHYDIPAEVYVLLNLCITLIICCCIKIITNKMVMLDLLFHPVKYFKNNKFIS